MADRPTTAYVGVGSNIEPERNIRRALDLLKQRVHVAACSTFYRTAPVDRPDQPPFLNGVWRIETPLTAYALKFDVLRPIEADLGRVRTVDPYAARPIDLDVLLYGDVVVDEPDLRIPDPDIRTRSFLSVPLLELDPELVLPDTHEPLALLVSSQEVAGMELQQAFTRQLQNILTTAEP